MSKVTDFHPPDGPDIEFSISQVRFPHFWMRIFKDLPPFQGPDHVQHWSLQFNKGLTDRLCCFSFPLCCRQLLNIFLFNSFHGNYQSALLCSFRPWICTIVISHSHNILAGKYSWIALKLGQIVSLICLFYSKWLPVLNENELRNHFDSNISTSQILSLCFKGLWQS